MYAALHDRKSGVKCAHLACWCQFYSSCSYFLVTSWHYLSSVSCFVFWAEPPIRKMHLKFCGQLESRKRNLRCGAHSICQTGKWEQREPSYLIAHQTWVSALLRDTKTPQEINFSMKLSPCQEQEMNWLHFTVKLINSGRKVNFNLKNRSRSWLVQSEPLDQSKQKVYV